MSGNDAAVVMHRHSSGTIHLWVLDENGVVMERIFFDDFDWKFSNDIADLACWKGFAKTEANYVGRNLASLTLIDRERVIYVMSPSVRTQNAESARS